MIWLLRVPPRVVDVVSTIGTSSVIVIVSLAEPGCRTASTRKSLPTSSKMFFRSNTLKPFTSARTVYVPGKRLPATYAPSESVFRVCATPRCTSVMMTVAPAMYTPDWSVTAPEMRPVFP